MSRVMRIKGDERLPKQQQDMMQELRGDMLNRAESKSIPNRFIVEEDKDTPSVWIIDTETGVMSNVSLYAYSQVRKAISELFGGI